MNDIKMEYEIESNYKWLTCSKYLFININVIISINIRNIKLEKKVFNKKITYFNFKKRGYGQNCHIFLNHIYVEVKKVLPQLPLSNLPQFCVNCCSVLCSSLYM